MTTQSLAKLKKYATKKACDLIDKYNDVKYAFETTPEGESILMMSYEDRLDALYYNPETENVEKAGIAYYSYQKDRTKEKNKFMYVGYIRSYDQRQGIGSLMMQYLERLAKENDCKFIDLIAAAGTEGFYKKFGFKRNHNRKTMHHYAKDVGGLENNFNITNSTNNSNL